jgi:hypothetical protein
MRRIPYGRNIGFLDRVYYNSSQIIDTTKREQLIQWTKSPWSGLFNSAFRYSSADSAEPVQLLHRPTPARRGPFWDTQFCLPREKGVWQYIQVVTPHSRHFRHIYKCIVTANGITGTQTAGSAWLSRYVQRSAAVQIRTRQNWGRFSYPGSIYFSEI